MCIVIFRQMFNISSLIFVILLFLPNSLLLIPFSFVIQLIIYIFIFKGTGSQDWFGLWWHVWSVLSLNRGCGQFLNFCRYSDDFLYNTKCVFLAVKENLGWLNNVIGVYLVQVSLLFIGQQCLGHFFRSGPCFQLAGVLRKFYANGGGKRSIQRHSSWYTSSKPIHFYQIHN